MFGYPRRGAEIRPSVHDGVAPMNPTPSTSHQGGIHNGRLQYVRMYVCTYVRMYVCMYVCTYVRMYVCMYVCMYVSSTGNMQVCV